MKKVKARKMRQKRWLKKRIKRYERQRFIVGFRNCFVKKGILKK